MLRCPNPECRNAHMFRKPIKTFLGIPYKWQMIDATTLHNDVFDFFEDEVLHCVSCKRKNKVSLLIDAFINPSHYFDTDNLCMCGGEIWQDFEIEKPKIDPNVEWEGSQRKVAMAVIITMRCEKCGKEYKKSRDTGF